MFRAIFKLVHRLFFKRKDGEGILVVQPLPGIGDVIWFLPHMHAIADHGGQISLMTKPRSFANVLLEADSSVSEIVWLERNPGRHSGVRGFFRLVREIRKKNYRQAWLLHGSSRYAWLVYLAGIPDTYGYGIGSQKLLLSHQECFLTPAQRALHGIDRATALLTTAGVAGADKDPVMRFRHYDSLVTWCIERYALADNSTIKIAFAIGSSAPGKQWGAENFALLANEIAELATIQFILVGGPAEQALADSIIRQSGLGEKHFVRLTGVPLQEVAVVLSVCDACVGNDTGVLNISAAVNTRSVGLFGSTTPLHYSSCLYPLVPPGNGAPPDSRQQGQISRMHEITVSLVVEQLQKIVPFGKKS